MSYQIDSYGYLTSLKQEGEHSSLTMAMVKRFVKDEFVLQGPKNIQFYIESQRGHDLLVSKAQFFKVLEQHKDGDTLRPYYDNNGEGTKIRVRREEGLKTVVTLAI